MEKNFQVFRICNAFLIISAGWRLLNYAQTLSSLAFMIKMIQMVAVELIPFVILFALGLSMFAFVFASLNLSFSDEEYGNIGKYTDAAGNEQDMSLFPMMFWVLRTSMGDFDISEFQKSKPSIIIGMAVAWMCLVLINLLIFLNFLIAVIGDVYA